MSDQRERSHASRAIARIRLAARPPCGARPENAKSRSKNPRDANSASRGTARRWASWQPWPLNHWTDSKIRVHALYCTVALLLRGLAVRRVRQAGMNISMRRFLAELETIREVVNIYPKKRGKRTTPQHTVLTKTSELQDRLLSILGLAKPKEPTLG